MKKIHILDTSILIADPTSFKQFPNSDIIIPGAVLNELDSLKKQSTEAGKKARVCIKLLDELTSQGNINKGIWLSDIDTMIKIDVTYFSDTKNFGPSDYGDTQILMCAYEHWLANQEIKEVLLVSNDINLRIKAKAHGISSIQHVGPNNSLSELYSGIKIINDENAGLKLQENNFLNCSDYNFDLAPNECVVFENDDGDVLALGRENNNKIKLIRKIYPWSLNPRNKEQIFAIDLIMDKNIDLVTLIGKAGTGKSLIVLAAALELVLNKKEYDKLIIYRPIQAVGNDIGFLPGTMEEKLAPWFQAIMDNFEFLLGKNPSWKKDLELYKSKGRIEMEAITYIRGRTMPNTIIFVDEAQNLTKEEVKTILTRAGEGTKVIITGDIEQIDNNILDALNNGLTNTIEKFKTCDISGHVTFTQGERSRLATLASEIL